MKYDNVRLTSELENTLKHINHLRGMGDKRSEVKEAFLSYIDYVFDMSDKENKTKTVDEIISNEINMLKKRNLGL